MSAPARRRPQFHPLTVPAWPDDAAPAGRLGEHGPGLAELLETLQSLARQHPAATW